MSAMSDRPRGILRVAQHLERRERSRARARLARHARTTAASGFDETGRSELVVGRQHCIARDAEERREYPR